MSRSANPEDSRTAPARRRDPGTAARILDIAERLVQSRGFNGFSYADVAEELGITKASLHYHFAGEAELGEALIDRYAARFADALAAIDAGEGDARAKLDAYAGIYADVLADRRMCLCGMLAADYETLPGPMRDAVVRFFDDNEPGSQDSSIRAGRKARFGSRAPPRDAAQAIVGGLEGAMLVARPYGDVARFQAAADQLLAGLASTPAGERP